MIINNILSKKAKVYRARILMFIAVAVFVTLQANIAIALPSKIDENSCKQVKSLKPEVTTSRVIFLTANSAEFVGSINPKNEATKYWFEYSQFELISGNTGFIYAGNDNESKYVSIKISNLKPNTEYKYRLVASNNQGVSQGEFLIFKTLNN